MLRQSKGHNFVETNLDFVATKLMTKLSRDLTNPNFVATKPKTNFVMIKPGTKLCHDKPRFCFHKAKDIVLGIPNANVATPKMSRLKC